MIVSSGKNLGAPPPYHQPMGAPHSPGPSTPIRAPQMPVYHGPTPINPAAMPLPYYDPHSPHSQQQSAQRARRRFFGSLLVALGIWVILGWAAGMTIDATIRANRTNESG